LPKGRKNKGGCDMKYKVNFDFLNELNEWKEADLDNNGEGFTEAEAIEVARQLIESSTPCKCVQCVELREVDNEAR
jgi:hypothetical protein